MSEPIPESIPTSADPRSRRPVKKARGPATATSQQSAAIDSLFAKPEKPIYLPTSATKGPKTAADLPAPPEIVANVQGSSAGAGSGEFHVYKAARRREYERIRLMEEEAKREEEELKWEKEREEKQKKDEEKTSKNAKRRARKKENMAKKKSGDEVEDDGASGRQKIALKPRKAVEADAGRPTDLGEGNTEADKNYEAAVAAESTGMIIHDDES